jgi:bacteriocin-like protein
VANAKLSNNQTDTKELTNKELDKVSGGAVMRF